MKSRLYQGRVWHTRRNPEYTFEYSVWYLGLDLSEVNEVDRRLRLFSHNRFNLSALWDRDYLALNEASLVAPPSGSVELVTMPRFLGHVFNPVSFFLHRDATGEIADVTAEVHNTWSEQHIYRLRRQSAEDSSSAPVVEQTNTPSESPRGTIDAGGIDGPSRISNHAAERSDGRATGAATAGSYTSSAAKALYVSPFIDIEGDYRFELREDHDGRLRIRIDEHNDDGWFFGAGIDVTPLELTDGNLARLLIRYPFVNLKTIAMIHWQGLRIWRQGGTFRSNPSRSKKQRRTATGER